MTDAGPVAEATGEPTAVSAPVLPLMANTETLLEMSLATKANLPRKSTVTETGPVTVATGEPTAVSAPVPGSMANTETLLELWFVT